MNEWMNEWMSEWINGWISRYRENEHDIKQTALRLTVDLGTDW